MRASLKTIAAAAVVAALAGALAGCSSGGADASGGKVDLTYWTWAPNMDKVAALWNAKNPDIHVTVNKQDGGDAAVTKLLTAVKAGSGAPDIMQAEYQKIPTLVSADALADIKGDLDSSTEKAFPSSVWNAVTLGSDDVYAVPQDSGPMMFFYRSDIFTQLGLDAPKTWDDYAADAATIHEKLPNAYLGTFSAGDPGWFTGLTQQAGASWWGVDGKAWKVDIDSAASKKVASYWGGLVEKGVVDNKPMYTPEWNAALNDGTQVGWIGAVWGPGVLSGNAADTAGKWKASTLPQWTAGDDANGNWGGSSTAVTKQSKHPKEAAKFIEWLNTDPAAVAAMVKQAGIYPAATEPAAKALTSAPEFFSNQPDFYDVAAKAAKTVKPFTYGPDVNVTYSSYNDEFAKAADAKQSAAFLTALSAMQSTTVADMKKSGFTVK